MFANNCNKAIRCCVWQTSTKRSFMANKLSTIIDRCAIVWLMLPTPWGCGRKKEKRKWTRVESMRHFTLHCNTFRATYWYWPCLERQARRSFRCGPRTPLELIVIAERKARINMQQTEREGGKKSELTCRNMRLITEQQSNVATGTQLGMRAKKFLSLAKLKSMKLAIKIRLPSPRCIPLPLGYGTVAWEPWCVHSSRAWSTLLEVSANVCHIIDDDCHRNSLVFSTF